MLYKLFTFSTGTTVLLVPSPICPGFSVEKAGNYMTSHDMAGCAWHAMAPRRFLEKHTNKWSSRDLTGLKYFMEINGN